MLSDIKQLETILRKVMCMFWNKKGMNYQNKYRRRRKNDGMTVRSSAKCLYEKNATLRKGTLFKKLYVFYLERNWWHYS